MTTIPFRNLLSFLVVLLVDTAVRAQGPILFSSQPEDTTIQAGLPVIISSTTLTGFLRQTTAYRGVHPDVSSPLPDTALINIAGVVQFLPGPLFETTQFWLRICNDVGCEDSRNFTVFVESAEGDPVTAALGETSDLGEGWVRSNWLADFNIGFFPWIFHARHSWLFISEGSSPEGLFLFDLSSEAWFWTNAEQYPNLFSFGRSSWVFYFVETAGPRQFVDLVSGDFFNLE